MKYLARLILLVTAALTVQKSDAYRVLFVGAFSSSSHKNFFMGIINELAEKGNHVTFVTPFPSKKNTPNVREVVVPEGSTDRFNINRFNESGVVDLFTKKEYVNACSDTLATDQVQDLLKEEFDVVLISLFFSDCYLSFVHQMQIPLIYVSPIGLLSVHAEAFGNPTFPAFVSPPIVGHSHPLTFIQRATNAVFEVLGSAIFKHGVNYYVEWDCRNRGLCPDDMPSINEMQLNASLIFLNSVKVLEVPPRPYVPGIIHLGGIHCRPAKPLPQDLQEWIDGAGDDGFIFFSLGSVVKPSDLPEKNRQIIVKVFSSLKQRVLWKWDKESMPDMPPNVRISKWLPQQDILAHPKLRLFITHGGLLSTLESIYHGMPILGMPVFADQTTNMMEVDRQGWGKVLLWEDLTEETLLTKINTIMTDQKIHEEVKFRSTLMRDQPMSQRTLVSYWVDYIVHHKGAKHLRCPISEMPWYKVYNIDVWITIMLVAALLVWLSVWVLYALIKCLCGKSKAKVD